MSEVRCRKLGLDWDWGRPLDYWLDAWKRARMKGKGWKMKGVGPFKKSQVGPARCERSFFG